jgi:diketogulonate reductase-like aldo/keto reductase
MKVERSLTYIYISPGYINLDRNADFGPDARTLDSMQTQANLVLDRLFKSTGLPWVDCARSYGLSEKFTSEYLRKNKIAPEKVYVSSKWGYSELAGVLCVESTRQNEPLK